MMTTNRDKLAAWRHEYELWRALEVSADADAPDAAPDAAADVAHAEEPPPADGQIRLWPGPGGPVYAWVSALGYDRWLLTPFSVLAEPALPAEFCLRREGPARVLQAWNARTVSGKIAAASWKVDEIPESERFLLDAWLAATREDVNASGPWDDRTGPPLRHPLDPRQTYLETEADRVGECVGDSVGDADNSIDTDSQNLPRAAESPDRAYGEDEPANPEKDPDTP